MSFFSLIIIVLAYACVECSYFPSPSAFSTSQFQNQNYNSQNQNGAGSSNGDDYGTRIRDYINIKHNLVPVALLSHLAKPINYPTLKISVRRDAQLLTKNDGYFVSSVPRQGQGQVATLTGGPANGKVYLFGLLAQNQDGYPNKTRVSTTEDGVGFPIQVQIFFYNAAYGSLINSLNYTDGLIQIVFNVLVEGRTPNPLFEPYRSVLTQVKYPNSTAVISAYNAFEWLLSTLTPGYYVHPSSYIDLPTGREFPCAVNISPSFEKHPSLSYTQWETFKNLLNRNYQSEANPLPLFPLAGRFFVQANGPTYYSYY